MNGKEIFITGADGQLGRALRQKYPTAKSATSSQLDITDSGAVANFDWSGTKIILNAAAFTDVDGAETGEGRIAAWSINAAAVGNLVRATVKHNITIVHISTDYVFDGTKDNHAEDEPLSPLGVYAQSKAAGDIAAAVAPKHYLIRTSWVVGDGPNFVRTMLELGKKGVAPRVVSDQVGRLTFTTELVKVIDHLLTKNAPYGTYNASNSGQPASRADIAQAIFEEAGYNLTVADIITAEYFAGKSNIAPRPLRSTLKLDKLRATGFRPTGWRKGLHEYILKERPS